ncbi:DMT family transporter [Pseudomonas eucalypticola]|uniref:EamA family transporter n=1 Tax=Pseudomonas eucalypticola TaxID=2599595 RepID=A0A7D5D748_9PSED|nr:DMT family transporter [Pseudomonas eucalypticola]QKZ04412.1 EamA family transporter [Pseudomonas eucalypticola]
MLNPHGRGVLEMATAMVISGTVGWFVLMSGQSATAVVFWRCVFGALAMLVAGWLSGVFKRGRATGRQWVLMGLGGVALVLNWVLLFSAYHHATLAVATVVYHTQPFMLMALSVVLLGERFSVGKSLWLLLAFAGLVLIVVGQASGAAAAPDYRYGVALALGSAFFYALAALIAKQLRPLPAHLIVLAQMVVGMVILAPFTDFSATARAPGPWACLVIIGMVHTGLMSTLLYSALQRIPTAMAGALSFIYPVVAILVDWLAFSHPLSLPQLVGAAVILLAAAGMNVDWGQGRRGASAHNVVK